MNPATGPMRVPFVDLKAQYAEIKPEIDAAIAAVIGQTAFVGGPFVKAFDEAFGKLLRRLKGSRPVKDARG